MPDIFLHEYRFENAESVGTFPCRSVGPGGGGLELPPGLNAAYVVRSCHTYCIKAFRKVHKLYMNTGRPETVVPGGVQLYPGHHLQQRHPWPGRQHRHRRPGCQVRLIFSRRQVRLISHATVCCVRVIFKQYAL